MCGLFGAFVRNPDENSMRERASESLSRLSHRGPDGHAIFMREGVVLGHTRLSFLDLSEHANQPFSDATGRYQIVYNGEIYNFSQLKSELVERGYTFRTGSDTEVLLYGLIEYGEEFLSRLEGMFAFVFVDLHSQQVLVARDRFGIKPLFYVQNEDGCYFASEIKALHAWHKITPDDLAIAGYLSGHYMQTSGRTFAKGVSFFPVGSYARFEIGSKMSFESFYEIPDFFDSGYADELSGRSVSSLIDTCDELLSSSVRKHMIADVPVGALCSGGVDSSLILAMAARENSNLQIFHANVVGPHSETDAARCLANHLKLDLAISECHDADFMEQMPDVIYQQEFPFIYHPNSVPFLKVARLVKENNVKAVLTGEGADEALLGYADLPLGRLISQYYRVMDGARAIVHRVPWVGSLIWRNPQSRNELQSLLSGLDSDLPAGWLASVEKRGFSLADARETLPLLSYHLRTLLTRNDRLGMAASIEARFPFLDHDFIRFCVNLPRKVKIHSSLAAYREVRHPFFATKWILREVANRYLPAELSQRRKRGFPTNAFDRMQVSESYFRGSWVQQYLTLTDTQFRDVLASLDGEQRLRLVMLDIWGRIFVDQQRGEGIRSLLAKTVSIQ
jgi:asparagine synthase (glutamine-hydrolysing)